MEHFKTFTMVNFMLYKFYLKKIKNNVLQKIKHKVLLLTIHLSVSLVPVKLFEVRGCIFHLFSPKIPSIMSSNSIDTFPQAAFESSQIAKVFLMNEFITLPHFFV